VGRLFQALGAATEVVVVVVVVIGVLGDASDSVGLIQDLYIQKLSEWFRYIPALPRSCNTITL